MTIDNLTIKELKYLISFNSSDDSHWVVGKNYFIRTVTHHFVGTLLKVTAAELVLNNCSWIADDGRFSDSVNLGKEFNEIEPYDKDSDVIIGRGALIDAHAYKFDLPTKQK